MKKTKDLSRRILSKILNCTVILAAAVVIFGCFVMQASAATVKVTASSVNIRKEASTSSAVVNSANSGDSFTVQNEVTGADGYVWYQISVNNQLGYIRSDLVQKSESTTPTTPSTPSVDNSNVTEIQPVTGKITSDNVRVRDAAADGSVIATMAKDATVQINGMTDGTDGYVWYRVNFSDVTGFVREDFLQLTGEVIPVTEEPTPEPPSVEVEDPIIDVEEPVVIVRDYETLEEDGVWYLADNTSGHKYIIADIFDAAQTNADLYEKTLETVNSQKIFIIILVLLVVAGGTGVTLLFFKMKDMVDEAYFEEVERETLNKRQNKQQNVMHTVGKEAAQKKPVVNGQQRPVSKSQQVSGKPKQMPKQQSGGQMKPNMTAQTAGAQVKQGQSASQARPQNTAQAKPAASAQTNGQVKSQNAAQARNAAQTGTQAKQQARPQSAQPQQTKAAVKPANTKANQEWKTRNFMTEEEDDFEFEFLNWDGEEEL